MSTHSTTIEARKARLEELRAIGKRIEAERYGAIAGTATRSAEKQRFAGKPGEEKRRAELRAAGRAVSASKYGRQASSL